jgi:hypothetical protein
MYELPPLRPMPTRTAWRGAPDSASNFDGPAYSTQTRPGLAYPFPNSSNTTPSLAAISVPSPTPPPVRPAPRLRDARQRPYSLGQGARPNAHNLSIARSFREPEHTSTDPSFAPDSAQEFAPGPEFRPTPPYHEEQVSWNVPQIQFDNGGFGMRQEQQGDGIAAPMPTRPRAYEVGPSGERVEYDVPMSSWGSYNGPPLYADTPGAGASGNRSESRGY